MLITFSFWQRGIFWQGIEFTIAINFRRGFFELQLFGYEYCAWINTIKPGAFYGGTFIYNELP